MTVAMRTEGPSTDLAMPVQDHTIGRLMEWAQAAEAAYSMSAKLANTSFVPAKYRGKPAEMTAAILAGSELGIGPMHALQAFHDIQGAQRPSAATQRAVVQGHGHEIRIVESNDERAIVTGRRKGEEHWQTSTWTFAKANTAGFPKKNPNWNTQREAMLIARASSEVCRWIASDALAGMPYSAEEAQDMDGAAPAAVQPRRVTAAELLEPDAEPTVAPVRATAEVGERQAEAVQPVSSPPAAVDPDPMPANRQKRMFALFNDTAFKERDVRLAFISTVVGREIGSSSDLTAAEGEQVITALENHIAEQNQGAPQDGGSE